ncbi:armadillo-type protein [Gilbertella persicaria]|uniref:armadillo-type protein n=1 Tax=Gilbertella persicaria TaxID=101096 RepID=UPI00221F95DF|nr:armadillo-type protein [Gilbertella persicaria]KAI8048773.1 armadillo-type protein [Gilbertella persicaria]
MIPKYLKLFSVKTMPLVCEVSLSFDQLGFFLTRFIESVECINDPNDTLENKVIALDNLELLIEGIDNARNIENMKLWPGIIQQLSAPEAEIRQGTAWVCGTAVQNNPEAQQAFLENQGLDPLIQLLKDSEPSVCNKALYAISGFLKHNAAGVKAFDQHQGFQILQDFLHSDNPTVLRKVVFLYNSLIFENDIQCDILEDLDAILTQHSQDEDLVEKTLRTMHTLVIKKQLSLSDSMKQHIQEARKRYSDLALAESEFKDLE